MIDASELSKLTQQAIEQGQQTAAEKKRAQAQAEAQQQVAERTRADEIVAQVPARVRDAAAADQTYALIMGLREGVDVIRPTGEPTGTTCDEQWLVGTARLVWQSCLEARLNPKLQYWGDAKSDQGFNIVIHWQRQNQPAGEIDASEWRRLTDQAIEEGRREAARLAEEEARALEHDRQLERAKALSIISEIPNRARTAAKTKQSYAIAMSLRDGSDFKRPYNDRDYAACNPDWLTGTAKLVWDACVQNKLKPELQYWCDGGGMDSGFNLVVHW